MPLSCDESVPLNVGRSRRRRTADDSKKGAGAQIIHLVHPFEYIDGLALDEVATHFVDHHLTLSSIHPGAIWQGRRRGILATNQSATQKLTRQMLPFLFGVYLFFDPFLRPKPRFRSMADQLVVVDGVATKRSMCKYRFDGLIYYYLPPKDFSPFHFPFDLCGCRECVGLSSPEAILSSAAHPVEASANPLTITAHIIIVSLFLSDNVIY